ncbi:MAG: hypothetical protein PWR01_2571 [Clostridiales bacterium]|nr:hypothetical protein [Clostridiales bacterium]MDN5281498.1 hypothetical protein [Candidatus Ozemobacter sp.]
MNKEPDLVSNENDDSYFSAKFYLMILGLTIFRLFLSLYLDLTPDEAYYWELSRRLDWSYYDHPPMVAYIIALFGQVLGDSHLAIRLPSVLGAALTSWFIFKIGHEFLKSSRTGFLAALMFNFTPAGMAVGFITTPDTPLALFWAFGAYAFLKALDDKRDRWWIMTGLALGAGALSKYNMIFFVPGVAITILAFPKYRGLVFTRRYWLMVGLAALGTLPIIYWNINHDWISFKFQFDHGLKHSNRSVIKNLGDFLGGQLGTIGLTLFPVLWFVTLKYLKITWKNRDEIRFFLVWLALPMMAFFVYTGIRSKVEANWPQIAYVTAMLLVGEWILAGSDNRRRNWVLAPSVFLALLAVLQSITLVLPIPVRSDISTRLHGWKQMGEIVQKFDEQTGKKAIFVAQGAPLAALVGFYGKIEPGRITETHGGGNFRFWWNGRRLEPGTDMIYVDDDKFSEASRYTPVFAQTASHTFPIKSAGRHIRNLNVNLMQNLESELELK